MEPNQIQSNFKDNGERVHRSNELLSSNIDKEPTVNSAVPVGVCNLNITLGSGSGRPTKDYGSSGSAFNSHENKTLVVL